MRLYGFPLAADHMEWPELSNEKTIFGAITFFDKLQLVTQRENFLDHHVYLGSYYVALNLCNYTTDGQIVLILQGPFSLTGFNFNPSMDK